MSEKYYSKLSTNLLLMRENKGKKEVLLQLRQNTGYMDGMYDFTCGGHVEKNESYAKAMIRESSEEIGITIKEEDLIFLIVFHHFQDDKRLHLFPFDKLMNLQQVNYYHFYYMIQISQQTLNIKYYKQISFS